MDITSHERVHREHQADHREHAAWLDGVARWRKANQQALALLASLRLRIVEHDEDLVSHEQVIVAHGQQLARHEAEIAGHERSGETGESARHREEHQGFVTKHLAERERHALLARNQRQVQLVIRRLEKVLHVCH